MENMRLIPFLAAAFILLVAPVHAQIPEPYGFVNDYAAVLGPYAGGIESLAAEIEKTTSAEIAIVIIPKLPEEYDIFTYGVELFEKWGIGKRGQDNGVLILVAVEEKKWRIEVGYGLEGALNDAKVGRIARETIEKAFETGQYGAEVYNAVGLIAAEIESEPAAPDPMAELIYFVQKEPLTFGAIIILVLIGIAALVLTGNGWVLYIIVRIIMMILTRGRFGGGRSGGGGAGRFISLRENRL